MPVVGQLHGTELPLLRPIEAGAPAGWRFAVRWAGRQRRWAPACERLIVPPGAAVEVARLLSVALERVQTLLSGVELELSSGGRSGAGSALLHWRCWPLAQHQQVGICPFSLSPRDRATLQSRSA